MKKLALKFAVPLTLGALSVIAYAETTPVDTFAGHSYGPFEQLKMYAQDAFLTAFRPGLTETQKVAALRRHGLVSDPNCQSRHFVRALISPLDLARGITVEAKISALQQDRDFRYAEPDFVALPDQVATDPSFGSQWGLHNTGQTGGVVDADIDAPEGWPLVPAGAPPVVVAVLDNGFDINHPDLAANIWVNPGETAGDGIDNDGNGFVDDVRGWNFSNNTSNVIPASASTNHGSHCIGIVAMVRNNGVGGAGTAKNVRGMPLQITGGSVSFYSAIANAIDYASLNGAKVISLSYTIDGYSQTFSDAIGRAGTRDVVYVNSGGNTAISVDGLRGRLRNLWDNVVIVASTDQNDALSSFSNFGMTVDVGAPGSSIYSTVPFGSYANLSGTSMAAPMAAAVIAQIRQVFPALSAKEALFRLRNSSDRLPTLDGRINGGRANLARALENDSVAPSSPAGLTVLQRSYGAINIQFAAAGDDGAAGSAARYDIRSSTSPITAANFGSAESSLNMLGGEPIGTTLSHQVRGLVPGRQYYIAVRAIDNVGNVSSVTSVGPVRLVAPQWIDDVESAAQWTSTGWGVTTAKAWSGTRSWTDSPSGTYATNANNSLTTSANITLPANPILKFRGWLALETYYDFLHVDVSTNDGATWTRAGVFTGGSFVWDSYAVSLAPWAGQAVRLRLRLTSDGSNNFDGVYIDDLSIVSGIETFNDTVEGANQFTGTGSWAKTTTQSLSPVNSWTDTPTGNTPASSDTALNMSASQDTSGLGDPQFHFAMRTAFRLATDIFSTRYSLTNGASWIQGTLIPSPSTTWGYYSAPIPSGTNVRAGTRLRTGTGTTQDGVYLDNFRIVGEPFFSGLSGTLTRSGYIGNVASRQVSMEIRRQSTNALLATVPVPLSSAPSGSYALDTLETGTVALVFKGPGFISRRVNNVVLGWNAVVPSVVLPNGDADGSGEIDAADIDLVISAFGAAVGNPGYSEIKDVDGSGEIDAADIDIAISHFGATSDQ